MEKGGFKILKLSTEESRFIGKELNSFTADLNYYSSNVDKLIRKYPNQYVAIRDKTVVACGKSRTELKTNLKKKNLEVGDCLVESLSSEEYIALV